MIDTIDALRQHQLVILRRLRQGPLTEFELAYEVSEVSGYSTEQAAENMAIWLRELRDAGLIWTGELANAESQTIHAAALTARGKELIN
ncbi:MAG: hypothetical protein ACYTHJ_14505 [Planctomycetota bacterium]